MSALFSNLPEELRVLNQWCLWKYEDVGAAKPTKVPYNTNGQLANVNNSATWSTFQDCFNCFNAGGYSGIGFIFSENDPYAFIDLDDAEGDETILSRHLKVYHEFDSYSEVSPSGKGLHIIVKGKILAGRRRSKIEVYSSQRYATMTGNVYNNKLAVNDRQELLTKLWEQMGSGTVAQSLYKGDDKETYTDEEIIQKATDAINGDKFYKLNSGNWIELYSSQSEADFAFVDIIAFYTQNRNQIARIFRASPLGKRDKANRKDYVSGMISRSFDRMMPPIDFDGMKNALEDKLARDQLSLPLAVSSSPVKTAAFDAENLGSNPNAATNLPPGLLGEIAQFIYQAAPRPVAEIALAAAIGLMAGICGKAYNVSDTGLNQYILLIADSGKGKEAMASGISKLVNIAKQQVPVANDFIGPSAIASSPGLHKFLSKNSQCFVSILGEFGIKLEAMSNQKANSVQLLLKDCILDLYHKSGYNDVYRGSAYSDQEKNSVDIAAPAFSILGESTPERFYTILTEEMINEGLLPRFTIIEYTGVRVASNPSPLQAPPFILIERLCALMAHTKTIMGANKVINIAQKDDALKFTKEIDIFADKQINSANKEITRQLWNRAHLKTLKLAAILAIGCDPYNPIITLENAQWAWSMVQNDIKSLSSKFEQGLIGVSSSEVKQTIEMKRVMSDYIKDPWEKVEGYTHNKALYDAKIISYSYINKRCTPMAAFKNDRLGPTVAIKRCLQIMIDSDDIKEVGKVWMNEKFGTSQRAFALSNLKILD